MENFALEAILPFVVIIFWCLAKVLCSEELVECVVDGGWGLLVGAANSEFAGVEEYGFDAVQIVFEGGDGGFAGSFDNFLFAGFFVFPVGLVVEEDAFDVCFSLWLYLGQFELEHVHFFYDKADDVFGVGGGLGEEGWGFFDFIVAFEGEFADE